MQLLDFYKYLLNNPHLIAKINTSNLSTDHSRNTNQRKRVSGLFKDEFEGNTKYKSVGLRAK